MPSVVPLLVSQPYVLAARCGVDSCTDAVLATLAQDLTANYKGFSSCESRINWLKSNTDRIEVEACEMVAEAFPEECGACHHSLLRDLT